MKIDPYAMTREERRALARRVCPEPIVFTPELIEKLRAIFRGASA